MNAIARAIIYVYSLFVSPLLGARCRFYPSCSAYAREAFARHDWHTACKLSLQRVLKCHPWHPGGIDRVPRRKELVR